MRLRTVVITFLFLLADAGGQGLRIQSRIDSSGWRDVAAVYPLKGQTIALKIDTIPCGEIAWFQIVPDCSTAYKNTNYPYDPDPYKWIGFAKIKYFFREMDDCRGKWVIEPVFRDAPFSSPYYRGDAGSFWVQAVVKVNGRVLKTPGIEATDYRGLSPKVFRISVREGEGFIGYLTSFFNVPGVFGSVPYQSYHYIGADCADVLMAAAARWKGKSLEKNYNVAMLVSKGRRIAEFDIVAGAPSRKLCWGAEIRQGDFLAVRYEGMKQYGHIGALYADTNGSGTLDAVDAVLHSGPFPLCVARLSEGGFDGHVVVVREE